MPSTKRVPWTEEHLLIALNLYGKIPFGRFHSGNPLLQSVAARMGRTTSSLAMKLSNFASLDPVLLKRGRKGLEGASAKDRSMWNQFFANLNELAPRSEALLEALLAESQGGGTEATNSSLVQETVPDAAHRENATEAFAWSRVRRGQDYFRQTILAIYDSRCCISGIALPSLLVASHIRPWAAFPEDRLNPRNGLCLSSIHDAAFDEGLITFDEDHRMVVSRSIRDHAPNAVVTANFFDLEGKQISPAAFLAEPDETFLEYHRTIIFKKRAASKTIAS